MKSSLMCLALLCLSPRLSSQEVLKETPSWSKNSNIYEVNIRQYTPEGTLDAFSEHLPRLNKMGVDILWLMPVQPIGMERRKGKLGSYYSISDYRAINPEYGNETDFKELVELAHSLGMKVILDWVANHSAWDHEWVASNPDFYTNNKNGYIVSPVEDWSDVADLNYTNENLKREMVDAMKFWIDKYDIDGFRCDVAGMVPDDFWKTSILELTAIKKDLFMLAEAEDPKYHANGFDMTYNWSVYNATNKLANGELTAEDFEGVIMENLSLYPEGAYRMLFTTNHDENSWNGTAFERLGEATQTMFVLSATLPGMPLIYSGQEAGLNKSLKFFEKDTISFEDLETYEPFYSSLLHLKTTNQALQNGEWGGPVFTIYLDDRVWMFARQREEHKILVIVNLSSMESNIKVNSDAIKGKYIDIFNGEKINLNSNFKANLSPWQYIVYSQDDRR